MALYSVASVHFGDGSSVDIAKIEGGPAYKQTMRIATISGSSALTHQQLLGTSEQSSMTSQIPIGVQSFRNFLPPWLGGRDARTQSLFRMLDALKTASKSYLEAPLMTAVVITPFRVTDAWLDALHSASSSLSLNLATPTYFGPGVLAAQAYGVGGDCERESGEADPEQFILTVHYSRAALTANVLKEECKVFESWRGLHNLSLGTNSLSKNNDLPGSRSSRDELADALRGLTGLPLENGGNSAESEKIRQLVLIGESANDERLHDALKEALLEHYGYLVVSDSKRYSSITSSTFLASRGAALYSWSKLDVTGKRNSAL